MKLKTLKDLNGVDKDGCFMSAKENPDYYMKEELKAEAVKWVKVIDKRMAKCDCKLGDCRICKHDLILRKWIKHFFNITEEDLK